MKIFIHPIQDARIIKREWVEELYPKASPRTSLLILQESIDTPKNLMLGAFDIKTKEIKGFLWGVGNDLDDTLFVNSIFVDKSCRRNPKIVGSMLDYIKENFDSMGYDQILFMTKKPVFFLRRGCTFFEETCVKYERPKQ